MIENTDLPDTCPKCKSGKIRLTVVHERIDNPSPGMETDWIKIEQSIVYRCGALLQASRISPWHDKPIKREVFDDCPDEESTLQKWCSE